ncbi:MAG: recombinase, partial [Pseudomonadota bacterium]|nr:recombinase [Pseudomonadota bacterium]
ENASRTGGHYVTTDRKGYWGMYRSAAGAGAIIALMATLKVLSGRLVLAPFARALISSLNYSLGFMLIHVLHFTVATKQPAMTAATLAATVQKNIGNRQAQIAELAEVTINIMRTQFIAILGNISIAMPIALLITWLISYSSGAPLMTPYKAEALLHDINPFISLAIPHAAIAGVWLFVSGLIAGYYDNLAVYHQIGPRMRQHPRLQRMFGQVRLNRISGYIESNLGALAGNFWFGVMLGSTGTIGYILGLPLDIRHIAFASANFVQGLYNLGHTPELGLVLVSFLGVLLIGLTNLMVSFGLALFVALRARRVQYSQWKPLLKLLFGHFLTRPADFIWPPKTLPNTTNTTHPPKKSH